MNIYVSNINFTTLDESLFNLFATYGEVASAKIITDRETGRSRGFGFVEMNDENNGQKAIDALNGTEFEGKTLNVSIARPREERAPRNSYGNNQQGYGNRTNYGNRRSYDRRNNNGYGNERRNYGFDRRNDFDSDDRF